MDGDIDLIRVPLTRLSDEARTLLSSLLNTKKILKNVCPDRISRYRDWRGLASLVNISAQVEVSINQYTDKVGKLLEIWQISNNNATIGQLMLYLQQLDRYDVYDDMLQLANNNKLIGPPPIQHIARVDSPEDDCITFQDVQYNSPQQYHAYVLFAPPDREFVDFMLKYLRDKGLKLCTEDDLLPGFSTRFEPVARLISQRCRRIILVYSPDFFQSNAVKFITHFAQAHGVETNIRNLIPIMYRYCNLPPLLAHYHNLVYPQHGFRAIHDCKDDSVEKDDLFWLKLGNILGQDGVPRLRNGTVSVSESSGVTIQSMPLSVNGYAQSKPETSPVVKEVSTSSQDPVHSRFTPQKEFLPLPDVPKTNSGSAISLADSVLSTQSESSNDKESKSIDIPKERAHKKKNRVERFFSQVRAFPSKMVKKKKELMVEN